MYSIMYHDADGQATAGMEDRRRWSKGGVEGEGVGGGVESGIGWRGGNRGGGKGGEERRVGRYEGYEGSGVIT